MEKNEKYISVGLDAKWFLGHATKALVEGKDKVYISFFKNTDRKKEAEPIYKCMHGALWINEKKERMKVEEIFGDQLL